MKIALYEKFDITDEQRVQLAVVLDEGRTKPKRQATRDEIKAFAWRHGSRWVEELDSLSAHLTAPQDDDGAGALDDLLGEPEDDLEDLL